METICVWITSKESMEFMFGTLVWNSCLELMFGISLFIWIMYGNPSLSKLCMKNPIGNVVGWYKISFMVYFEFWKSWFCFGKKFPVKKAKYGNFCIMIDTPTPRCKSAHLSMELNLGGGPYA